MKNSTLRPGLLRTQSQHMVLSTGVRCPRLAMLPVLAVI
jgi:hypothetical protein